MCPDYVQYIYYLNLAPASCVSGVPTIVVSLRTIKK
jgi:hypothetical protein